jgi:CO/xanthine dehydrogenase FAD-binding subunit
MHWDIFVPKTEEELLHFLESHGSHSRIVSGATDLLPRVLRRQEEQIMLVDICRLDSLRYLRREKGVVRVGALCTLANLTGNDILGAEYEAVKKLGLVFGSPLVRNLATVGGNLAASSSSEDLIPIFLTLDAKVTLRSVRSDRVIPLVEFIQGKRETSRMNDEILAEVSFNDLRPDSWCAFEKVGRRERVTISLVSLACTLTLNRTSGTVEGLRIALNRVRGKIPERAIETEEILAGNILSESSLDEACKALEAELLLTSDFRASAQYRVTVAKNLLRKLLMHCKYCIETGVKRSV